jgi:hypothetical protein
LAIGNIRAGGEPERGRGSMGERRVTGSIRSGCVGLLLVLLGPSITDAQSSNEDVRKRYVRCAAVLGVAAAFAADKKLQDGYSGASMLLTVWASELISQPSKVATDQATREFGDQVTVIGRDIGGKTPAAAKKFAAKYKGEVDRCGAFFVAEGKNRKRP